ncbi:MAG TPA: UDP-N-acetylglucosamine--N-acetylmuramyl-(pentapeptide) pyrophosphoryl-undecaprenol N-acetylglucosamine transferase [Candidatus Limnocylindria bacterium]|nr:UDP-N-acetylglucosamine--N-acetylmuramyl-(pentapeptide) pyrophosphoryl-undecaprenol N-acetylglucosamine transferase [Candidatus Limnocylindria bacterium]
MKILLVGGGSGGPVAPLLAIAEEIKKSHPKAHFLLVGTKSGPERMMAASAKIAFAHVEAGKLRRYASLKNLAAPALTIAGFLQAFKILKAFKPDCVFGTGSFVQVPVVWAAWLLKIPVVLHQQDLAAGLANKLCQFAAKKITVTFEASLRGFSESMGFFYKKRSDKIILTGNPFREELKKGDKESAIKTFNLKTDLPTLLVLGGGTGAEFINSLIVKTLPELSRTVQIIHSTGKGKFNAEKNENYHPYEFIDNMAEAYAAADMVVARAGLSTITELSHLGKLSIIIPLPESHQEINALFLLRANAAVVLNQQRVVPEAFIELIRKLLFAHEAQVALKANIEKIMPHDANKKISEIIIKLAEAH